MLLLSSRQLPFAAAVLFCTGLLVSGMPIRAQHNHTSGDSTAHSSTSSSLKAPGQSVFGTVQEAVRRLEANADTDWSEVDVAALHRHLKDMHHVALHVTVEAQAPIDGGVRLRVRPTREAARMSLNRVLDAHPHMLQQETGWTMAVDEEEDAYVLRVTTDDPAEVDKIRGLGYMGLLAYGDHHQRHHWHLVQGGDPHGSDAN